MKNFKRWLNGDKDIFNQEVQPYELQEEKHELNGEELIH